MVPSLNFQDAAYKPTTSVEREVLWYERNSVLHFLHDWTVDMLKQADESESRDQIILYKNTFLFTMFKNWCAKKNVKFDFNPIGFGI